MSSKIKSRAAGLLSVGIVALALGAASAVPATASASGDGAASSSSLTAKQKKAKRAELKKCYRIKAKAKRKACIKRVNKKYAKLAKPPVKVAATIDVKDDYYYPSDVTIKRGEAVKWVWDNSNANGHTVSLDDPFPVGLTASEKYSLNTPTAPATFFTFGPKQLKKPGVYHFVCELHSATMKMTVTVK